ncbi:hypothetical protein OIU77_022481 [Salix suchowensis]|uniref:Uncharacterized protein n=1 Tax=Salix suchowensis TaxID=1278906 RepID=A0ABQ9C4H2_9ROSI|nr:hypothetical protein OIU77_022481 [Salix suchowensis]
MRSLILEGSVDHFLQPTRRTALYLWRILSSYEYVLDAVAEVEEQKCQEVAAADNDPTKMSSQLLNNCRKSLRYWKVRLLGNKELITGN